MASVDMDVAIEQAQVKVTNRATGAQVTELEQFTENPNETITLWQSDVSITELRVSGPMWPGTSHLKRSPTPGTLRNSNGQNLLKVQFFENRVVLTDLNESTSDFVYKFGITIVGGENSYDWDPEVREKKPR